MEDEQENKKILTNITVISQSFVSSIPSRDFNMFSYVEWYDALQKGYIVEKHFMPINLNVIELMNDSSNMNVLANYRSRLIGCLTSIDLVVDV